MATPPIDATADLLNSQGAQITPSPTGDATAEMLAANGAQFSSPKPQAQRGALKSLLLNMARGGAIAGGYAAGIPQAQNLSAEASINNARAPYAGQLAQAQAQQAQSEAELQRQMMQPVTIQVPGSTGGFVDRTVPGWLAKIIAPQTVRYASAENVANINQTGANQRSDNSIAAQNTRQDKQLEASRQLNEEKLSVQRELTQQRLQASMAMAQQSNAAKLDAAQIRGRLNIMHDGMKSYDLALDSDNRYQQMLQQVQNPNPASDKALLFNHIAMTLGNVKGGRVTQAEIEAHLKARDLGSEVMQAWDKITTGKTLTPSQRQNFLNLASEVRNATWDRAYRRADFFGITGAPEDNPALGAPATNVPKPGSSGVTPPKGAKVRDYTQLGK